MKTGLMMFWGTLIPAMLITLFTASITLSQHGGKAEPNRIEFKRGTTSKTINGAVRGSEEAEYVLAAKKGQRLIIRLTSLPARSSVFQILDPDHATLSLAQGNYDLLGTLPKSGDYLITIRRPREVKGVSRYKITVSVR